MTRTWSHFPLPAAASKWSLHRPGRRERASVSRLTLFVADVIDVYWKVSGNRLMPIAVIKYIDFRAESLLYKAYAMTEHRSHMQLQLYSSADVLRSVCVPSGQPSATSWLQLGATGLETVA